MNESRRSPALIAWFSAALIATVFVAIAGLTPGASLADDVLTPHLVAGIQSVTAVAVSPDGRHVAYLRSVPRAPMKDEDGGAWAEVHVLDTRTGTPRPFVIGHVAASQIGWTPDGRSVTYLAKRGDDGTKSLYAIPVDGGESRRLLAFETDITAYSFDPEGVEVAFLAKRPLPDARQDLKDQGFKQEIFEEDRPFVEVHVSSVDLVGLTETDTTPRTLALEGSASLVAWSPVDQRLAVAVAPTPLVDDRYVARRVNVVDSRDGHRMAVVETDGKLGAVVWNPEGSHLALIGPADINDPKEGRLLVASVAGGEAVDLMPGFAGHVTSLRWRDAKTVLFVAAEGVWTTVSAIARTGGEREVLVPAGGPILGSLHTARHGPMMAFVGNSPQHPGEVFLMGSDLKQPTRATDSNPWLREIRLAEQEAVTYQARDGLELEGILFRPLDETPGERYPLILAVHGGPEAHRSNGWLTSYSNPGQMAAAEGIAVFYPNYRGSTARGVEFSKLGQGDPAGKEFDDVVDAIDHFVEAGLVDADRVGITGGSYGGYATAWGSTYYSDRFAAGVMFVGVSDNLSKFGTTDIPEEMLHVHQRKRVYDDWSFFLERSPIFHAGNSKTPLLILHGKDDPRVHYSQSLELYRHVKTRGSAPVRLVLYPGEKHGNRKAAARLDYNLRAMRWMIHYLKGPGGDMPHYELDYTPPGLKEADEEVPVSAQ